MNAGGLSGTGGSSNGGGGGFRGAGGSGGLVDGGINGTAGGGGGGIDGCNACAENRGDDVARFIPSEPLQREVGISKSGEVEDGGDFDSGVFVEFHRAIECGLSFENGVNVGGHEEFTAGYRKIARRFCFRRHFNGSRAAGARWQGRGEFLTNETMALLAFAQMFGSPLFTMRRRHSLPGHFQDDIGGDFEGFADANHGEEHRVAGAVLDVAEALPLEPREALQRAERHARFDAEAIEDMHDGGLQFPADCHGVRRFGRRGGPIGLFAPPHAIRRCLVLAHGENTGAQPGSFKKPARVLDGGHLIAVTIDPVPVGGK